MVLESFEDTENFPFLSIRQSFGDSGVRVPELYHFSGKNGLFLIEDLGDLSLESIFGVVLIKTIPTWVFVKKIFLKCT